MKILMLVNWKIEYCDKAPDDKQPPDYFVKGEPYWFYRYFKKQPEVDVVDISSCAWLEKFEKNTLRFYIWQTIKILSRLHKYDLVVSHGMQSGIVLSLWRRLFKTKVKHVVFDIGSFNSAAERGLALKLMQFASKSIDGIIYHTKSQQEYYKRFFAWLVSKSYFVQFGTDLEFFDTKDLQYREEKDTYIICVGYAKRDWMTVIQAYQKAHVKLKLRLVGHVDKAYEKIEGVEQIPFVPIQELKEQIYNARFAILPLQEFNYSYGQMTLLQQMALGKGVVVANVSSLKDYVQDGKTAFVYSAGAVNELTKLIRVMAKEESKNLIDTVGDYAKEYLLLSCNEKVMACNIEKVYLEVYDNDSN